MARVYFRAEFFLMLTPRKLAGLAVKVSGQPEGLLAGDGSAPYLNLCNVLVLSDTGLMYPIKLNGNSSTLTLKISDVTVRQGYSSLNGPNGTAWTPTFQENNILYYGGASASRYTFNLNPTYSPSDHTHWDGLDSPPSGVGSASLNRLTAYPIPFWNVLTVGSGKMYSTVEDAYNAAVDGDNIVIDAGTHLCPRMTTPTYGGDLPIVKNVRFYGATGNADDVILKTSTGGDPDDSFPIHLTSMAKVDANGNNIAPGFIHLTFHSSHAGYSWKSQLTIDTLA